MKKSEALYFASCPLRLESVLEKEIQKQGITETKPQKGGVSFEASFEQALKVLVRSRTASRVYKELTRFQVKDEKDLYYQAKDLPWHKIFDPTLKFKISVTQAPSSQKKKHSKFKNTLYLAQVIKDGLVDRFRAESNFRPSVEVKTPDVIFHAHIEPNENIHSSKEWVRLMIDLTGTPLSHRGYRNTEHRAPMRENLAAGILELLDWSPKEDVFIDLMTGSGTFLFEAFFKQRDLSPQVKKLKLLNRNIQKDVWAFQKLPQFEGYESLLKPIVEEEMTKFLSQEKLPPIIGIEIKDRYIKELQDNLEKYKIADSVIIKQADARTFDSFKDQNIQFFCNPPYGERLDKDSDLEKLYVDTAENIKQNYSQAKLAIVTGNFELLKRIRLKESEKYELFSGALPLRLVNYPMY